MESMVNYNQLFGGIYRNKTILLTGHTGFKGSWLAYWLTNMGAKVYGYALDNKELHHLALLNNVVEHSEIGDIRNYEHLFAFFQKVQPEIVFHLAAQALVRPSYVNPIETFSTNVLGTAHVLEASRNTDSVRAIVNITSDKCYENREWIWGYRESDSMGGFDPYSASKGAAEIITSSYRNSFFNVNEYGKKHNVLLASARAGNVIGGGDWALDRLIPDMIKATVQNETVQIRNPKATRPWQHVLEPLSGYLTLGWMLLENKIEFADAWNFGPEIKSNVTVNEVLFESQKYWENIHFNIQNNPNEHHEAHLLMLDCSKAHKLLKWNGVWDFQKTIEKTIHWYKNYNQSKIVNTEFDLNEYILEATKAQLIWTK
jgi:CDP-glucose 4,6-dehydratase